MARLYSAADNGDRLLRPLTVALDCEKARQIYQHKIDIMNGEMRMPRSGLRVQSPTVQLAKLYGVSSQTIRDIWNRRTWSHATKDMDAKSEGLAESQRSSQSILSVIKNEEAVPSERITREASKSEENRVSKMKGTNSEPAKAFMNVEDWPRFSIANSDRIQTEKCVGDDMEIIFIADEDPFHDDGRSGDLYDSISGHSVSWNLVPYSSTPRFFAFILRRKHGRNGGGGGRGRRVRGATCVLEPDADAATDQCEIENRNAIAISEIV
eukprot:CAMPEP_0113726166 /NCGR_PEP_ID=MMETSP0038_2-20120614/40241_1 /TAXON_ID=2898 /ORGANISM="Cryptomonas paramecium" /LENGTH=266 /DNA_ID=CAMNT_0000656663 /DNA_START=80 /DNA_END=881 /DNA_ORIENTATION=- /assembly_acc=CAM_ASM_000170